MNHEYSKVIAEGLRVVTSFIYTLASQIGTSQKHLVQPIFSDVLDKLSKTDIDQEVKQCSLIAMASLISAAHTQIPAQKLNEIVEIFGNRLSSELTRDASLKGLAQIARAPQSIQL